MEWTEEGRASIESVGPDKTRKKREAKRRILNKETDSKGRHTLEKLVGDKTVGECTRCGCVVDLTEPARCNNAITLQQTIYLTATVW